MYLPLNYLALLLSFLVSEARSEAITATTCCMSQTLIPVSFICRGGSLEDLRFIPKYARVIRIFDMPVSRITQDTFSQFPGLLLLACWNCQLTGIEEQAFANHTQLINLSLNNNNLTEVGDTWFGDVVPLLFLGVGDNKIGQIKGELFRKAKDLAYLDIAGNQLSCENVANTLVSVGLPANKVACTDGADVKLVDKV